VANKTNEQKDMDENKRLKAARVLRGLTQRELGARIGRNEIEISRLETGRATPDHELKVLIAEVLQKPIVEIFD
jgi:DNA-binding XRE family transcriptional regulator